MNSQQLIIQIGDLPWSKVFIYGFALVIAYFFLGYDDGSILQEQLQQQAVQLSQAKKGLEDTKKAMADADKFEQEVKIIAQQFTRIRDFMPEDQNAAQLTEIVTKQASLAGAKLLKLEPKNDLERVEFYEMTRMEITLEGTYPQIVSFLSYLSRVPKLLTFDKIKLVQMGGDIDKPNLNFTGTLVGYRFVKPTQEKGATSNGAVPAAPGAAPAGGAPNANL